ncbi:unnamed protein product [Prorocentrum cordatum]|uniref:Glycerophosphocholine acyltransferase 1 n=1 Tax=Prorocentrum cordatum TaxID=2364126 RepID=A0ABN9WCQ1_9DINO|nr:unnamed protein product [Polarella glacialis]
MPGGAKWFRCEKHLYFLLLSPYLIFRKVFFKVALKLVYLLWLCSTKLAMCLHLCTVSWNCCCSLIGCIVSFGLWAWAKESYGYWWSLIAPFCYFFLMQSWATIVAPIVFSVFYGLVNRMTWEQMRKGLGDILTPAATQAQDTVASGSAGLMEQPLADQEDRTPAATQAQDTVASGSAEWIEQPLADQEDIIRIINLNRTELEKDFSDVLVSENALEDDTKDDTKDSLDDTKIKIFFWNMFEMSSITLEQMLIISLVRVIFCSGSLEAYVGSYQLTIGERHWYTYYCHVAKLAERGIVSATNAIWMLV